MYGNGAFEDEEVDSEDDSSEEEIVPLKKIKEAEKPAKPV